MEPVPNFDLLDKVAPASSRKAGQDTVGAGLAAGGGRGARRTASCFHLAAIDGSTATYSARPRTEWRFDEVANELTHPATSTEATPSERAHQALEVLLAIVGDAEPRVRCAEHGANVPVSPH